MQPRDAAVVLVSCLPISDLSAWNVSNVTSTFSTFEFNGDLSAWNVSNVTSTFSTLEFNGDLSAWAWKAFGGHMRLCGDDDYLNAWNVSGDVTAT